MPNAIIIYKGGDVSVMESSRTADKRLFLTTEEEGQAELNVSFVSSSIKNRFHIIKEKRKQEKATNRSVLNH